MRDSRMLVSLVVGVIVAAFAVTGCAAPSLRVEAQSLLKTVQSAAGVETATLDYSEPVTLDSGKLLLRVTMSPGAGAVEAAEVVTTVYDAYATTLVTKRATSASGSATIASTSAPSSPSPNAPR